MDVMGDVTVVVWILGSVPVPQRKKSWDEPMEGTLNVVSLLL